LIIIQYVLIAGPGRQGSSRMNTEPWRV